jgi:hypothetical protein
VHERRAVADRRRRGSPGIGIDLGDDDVKVVREPVRDRRTEAAPGPGDDRDRIRSAQWALAGSLLTVSVVISK